jgi:CDP-glucose 4,6-dehydratase
LTALNQSFWRGKKVLITGHTGFKGSWLSLWLSSMGSKVYGISLEPTQTPNLYSEAKIIDECECYIQDIRNVDAIAKLIKKIKPEIVFHLAAQAIVRVGYSAPLETFSTNIQGTAILLDSLRFIESVRAVVVITTDKVYKNLEQDYAYKEEDTLGGFDPYSASKAASEIVISCYRDSYLNSRGISVASARAGNVIGGGDWSSDRIIPDVIRASSEKFTLEVRRPNSKRPWQHVLEPLAGYLKLAEMIYVKSNLATEYNFGPSPEESEWTVKNMIDHIQKVFYPELKVNYSNQLNGPHEANLLSLDISKAKNLIGYRPYWSTEESIRNTIEWYQNFSLQGNAKKLCLHDIENYSKKLHG